MSEGIKKSEQPWYSKATDPNEPVSPTGDHKGYNPTTGITKREYFSVMIAQGVMAAGGFDPSTGVTHFIPDEMVAERSVKIADKIIDQLNVIDATYKEEPNGLTDDMPF